MKVKELIDLLSTFNPECEVFHAQYDGCTQQREPIYSAEQLISNTWDCDNNCALYEVILE